MTMNLHILSICCWTINFLSGRLFFKVGVIHSPTSDFKSHRGCCQYATLTFFASPSVLSGYIFIYNFICQNFERNHAGFRHLGDYVVKVLMEAMSKRIFFMRQN